MSQSEVTAPGVSAKDAKMTYFGCLMLALAIAAFGLSLSNIQNPVLASMNGLDSFSLVTALTSASMCILTPIGGSLMDNWGTRKVVVVFGSIVAVCSVFLAFCSQLGLYILLRTILSAALGAFATVPFVAIRQIYAAHLVPKYVGYLSGALALGSFIGSWGAGWLMDHQLIPLASAFPSVFLVIGIIFIQKYFPDHVAAEKHRLDWGGIILLSVTLLSLVFSLNYAPMLGWGSTFVVSLLIVCLVSFIALIWCEKKVKAPLIPLKLFKNKPYVQLLIIAGLTIVYSNAINVYLPQGMQELMNQPAAISGTAQIPRTVMTILVPGFAGAWVARKYSNYWKALAIACILIGVPCGFLVFIGEHMPVWFVLVMLAFTGAADAFRTVATTPAGQMVLEPENLGIGTSLIGFIISLSGVLASALFSIAYNTLVQATPGHAGLTQGIDTVLLISAAAAFLALIIDIFLFRPMFAKAMKAKENKK